MPAPALAAPRRAIGQRLFLLMMLLLLAAFATQYTFKALKPGNRSAFLRWREQILQIDSGADIYRDHQYPNPPIMALLLRPLAVLDPIAGALLWFFLKVGMAVLALAAVFRLIEAGGAQFPPWAKAATVLLSLRPVIGDLSHGNINIFILFLVIAALYSWHRGYDILAGIVLALAISCKVTPALLVPYFLWKQQWKVVAGCLVGLGLFLFGVPGAALGWSENLHLLRSWTDQMVVPYLRYGIVSSEHPNQSLPGTVHRLLTHSPSFCEYPNDIYTPSEYHNVADIGKNQARWLIRAAQGLFALMVVVVCRAPARARAGWRLAAEFSIILVGMLLFSERTWKHHCVTLMMAFATLIYAVAVLPLSKRGRTALISLLAIALGLMFSASGVLSSREADLAQVYGAYTWAFLLLLAACIVVARTGAAHGERRSMTHPPPVLR